MKKHYRKLENGMNGKMVRTFNIFDLFVVLYGVMVFNTTFNNISVISWRSVLLVEETRVPRENYQPVASH